MLLNVKKRCPWVIRMIIFFHVQLGGQHVMTLQLVDYLAVISRTCGSLWISVGYLLVLRSMQINEHDQSKINCWPTR